jgi:hypothetical protein
VILCLDFFIFINKIYFIFNQVVPYSRRNCISEAISDEEIYCGDAQGDAVEEFFQAMRGTTPVDGEREDNFGGETFREGFDGSEKSYLQCIILLLNLQVNFHMTDSAISGILHFTKSMIGPEVRKRFPKNMKHVRKIMKHLGLECVEIDVYPNLHQIYYSTKKHDSMCSTCHLSRYRTDIVGKNIPHKVRILYMYTVFAKFNSFCRVQPYVA